ncbi:winged helix-turn-helix transcriptional regulator [Candidatus Bathyarchaeota archaeon]|nr:winged helix-turn-helix transcriptional regulator [Candidatus Bathyarchaeota archaeon]
MKDVELKLVSELMKNSRRSDRELARVLGLSQPTVGRMIKKLEKEGVIHDYTMVPDMNKLGIEMIAITVAAFRPPANPEERMRKCKEFVEKHPNILFLSSGIGTGTERVFISVHKDYSDYVRFVKEVKAEIAEYKIADTFLISYKGDTVLRQLSFVTLADYLGKDRS